MYIHMLHFSLEEFYKTHQNKKSAQVFKMKMYQIEGKDFRKQQCRFEQELKKKFRKHVNKQLLDREIYEVNIKLAEVYPEDICQLQLMELIFKDLDFLSSVRRIKIQTRDIKSQSV